MTTTSRPSRALPLLVTAASLALVLAGCAMTPSTPTPSATVPSETPTPTPTETAATEPPAAEDVILTADGLGPILMNQVPTDGPASMLDVDPVGCTDEVTMYDRGIEAGDPGAPMWTAKTIYDTQVDGETSPGFTLQVDPETGAVTRLIVVSPDFATDQGVHVGDPGALAVDVYPEATEIEGAISVLRVVEAQQGNLIIEIAHNKEYWGDRDGDVVFLRVDSPDLEVGPVAGSDAGPNPCALSA